MTNEQQITTIKQHLVVKGGKVFATSLDLANIFKKKHKDVLKAIRNLECSAEFNGRNFAPVEYQDNKGESRPMVEMTRDGFTMLAMGFTGPEAAKFREAYIAAFNQMEAELRQSQAPQISVPLGDYPMGDRPVVVNTAFGPAYINHAGYALVCMGRHYPGSEYSRLLHAALVTQTGLGKHLPEPYRIIERQRRALLRSNPIWRDIMDCRRLGVSQAMTARMCGCHASTVRRHLVKMEEAGLFSDPFLGMVAALEAPEARS